MKTLATVFVAVVGLAGFAWADGGVVIAQKEFQNFSVTVFASPVPLRAGPADIAVLVQDAKTKKPITDAAVDIAWSTNGEGKADWLPPCCSMGTGEGWQRASAAHSKNKLLSGVILPIKSEGASQFSIRVTRPESKEEFDVPVEALKPVPPAQAYWPLLAFPPIAMGLFALNRRIRK